MDSLAKFAIDMDYWINRHVFRMHPTVNMNVLFSHCRHPEAQAYVMEKFSNRARIIEAIKEAR